MEKKKLLLNSKGKALLTEDGKILIAPPNSQEILTKYININANGTYDIREYGYASVNVPIPNDYVKPSGNIDITTNEQVNVRNYETARVVDNNLLPENIKKDATILGVTGTYEGKKGLTATVEGETLILSSGTVANGTLII